MLSRSWRLTKRLLKPPPFTHGVLQQRLASTKLSPSLLRRAEDIATEHARLNAALAEGYDVQIAKRAGELSKTAGLMKRYKKQHGNLSELHTLIKDPTTDAELRALALEDIEQTTTSIESTSNDLASSLIPRHPFEHLPCLLEIRPGAGGSEAALFVSDLLNMYQSYCAQHGLPFSILKYEDLEGAGDATGSTAQIQEVIIEVAADGAYGRLRCEAGVHRVQRVPATEAKGRTHTSAASVLVLPSLPEHSEEGQDDINDPKSDLYLDPKDVRIEVMRARGAGGQHVNKTESAVRLTYLPNGTTVSMQDARSQTKNKDKAFRLLRAKIAQQRREVREDEMIQMRRGVVGVAKMGRGDKIRTYNWSQNRVTDHRSGFSVLNLDDTLRGGSSLEEIMESVRKWTTDQELDQLVASHDGGG